MAFELGGLGNISVTFSWKVMLLVLLGCGLAPTVALLGRTGRGGSVVGLPGDGARRDFLAIRDPPDLVRRWLSAGLDCADESDGFRGIGRGRLTTDREVPGVSATGAGFEGWPAVLMIASTMAGSLYWILLTNRMVRCCDPGSSATVRPRALGFEGRPIVGRLWSGVLVGSGGGVVGDGGSILEGRIFGLGRDCCLVNEVFCAD
jgi:hypothetical protein